MQTKKLMKFAVERHLSGDLEAAGNVYRKVLAKKPGFAEAWNLSGVLAYQIGRHEDGIRYITHAISLRDDIPEYHLNLATALMAEDHADEAETSSRKCLELDPNHKLAWSVLGSALHEQDSVKEAIQCFERAIEIDENHIDPWVNLGRLYRETNQLAKAEKCALRSLQIDANHPVALSNLGAVRHSQGRDDEALPLFERSLQTQPNAVPVLVNKGNSLQKLGRFQEAEAAFSKAIETEPSNANAWNSLGYLFGMFAQTQDALDCFQQAIELDPRHASAASNYLFGLNAADVSREQSFSTHIEIAKLAPDEQPKVFANVRDPQRQLRIGYLSPDLRMHPLVSFFEPILESHSTDKFDVFCYANVEKPDSVTARLQAKSPHWRSTFGVVDADVVTMIMHDQIDILIDLAGHTADNRLTVFAQRAAPVQVSMLGYLNTTGLATMDYLVSDEIRDPPSEDQFNTEEIIRLPEGGCCWSPPENAPAIQSPPLTRRGHVTFGSMHRPNKLTDRTLRLWSEIVNGVANSRLLLFHNAYQDSVELQGMLLSRLQAAGIEPDRIDVAWDDTNEYLVAYEEMDLLLESVPWSSGTTALEAMWQGVPVPTLYGASPCGRATASALNRLGLGELVAANEAEYIQLVSSLVKDTDLLESLRFDLRPLMQTTICDADAFVRHLESSYRKMWKRVCDE